VPTPPLTTAWSPACDQQWGYMGNDVAGCCVYAAMGHMIQVWTANDGVQFSPTAEQILEVYREETGYDPNDPSTDQGETILHGLKRWRNQGIAGHKIWAWAEIDTQDVRTMALVQYWFGGVLAGFMLPSSIWKESIWHDVTSVGRYGHAMPLINRTLYDWDGCTWDRLQKLTRSYMIRCDEGYAVLPLRDWTGDDGVAPNGFLWEKLADDLERVTR
jgi:hypothetical protein